MHIIYAQSGVDFIFNWLLVGPSDQLINDHIQAFTKCSYILYANDLINVRGVLERQSCEVTKPATQQSGPDLRKIGVIQIFVISTGLHFM